MEINQKKLKRQEGIVDKWIKEFNGQGVLEACTGFGKTFTALLAIKRFQSKNPNHNVNIVVPTRPLKEQWEKQLESQGFNNCYVYVVNTYIRSFHSCSLLILDEVHGFLSDEFYKVFENTNYQLILGLTATLERLDGKHELLLDKAPIFDTVSLEEARIEGYISNFTVYNLGLTFNKEDQKKYDEYHSTFNNTFSYFERDFELAMHCAKGDRTIIKIPVFGKPPKVYTGKSFREEFAKRLGWQGQPYEENDTNANFYHPKTVMTKAMQWLSSMRLRKKMVHVATVKIDVIEQLANLFPDKKIMIFSETSEFADNVAERLGEQCVSYHTNLKGYTEEEIVDKVNKRTGAITSSVKTVRISAKKRREDIIRDFKNGVYRIISCVKGLDEGFDDEEVDMAIMASYNSSKRQDTQRSGRAVREKEGKEALIVNLYMINSQEEKWLKEKQRDKKGVIWIQEIEELTASAIQLF